MRLLGLVAVLVVGACAAATPPPVRPVAPAVLVELDQLPVRPLALAAGYSRAQFGAAWADTDRNGCDQRNDVLRRDLTGPVLVSGSRCVVASGVLHDPYTGRTIAFRRGLGTSSAVQVDHVVALSDAWQTGAAAWTPGQRLAYATDEALVLLAVDGTSNESKGDADAASWLPPAVGYRCTYVAKQVTIKVRYKLWVTPSEHDAMQTVLQHC